MFPRDRYLLVVGACLAIGLAPRGVAGRPADPAEAAAPFKLKAPVSNQVFQRDTNNSADIEVVFPEELKDAQIVTAQISANPNRMTDGKFRGVPAGGPYQIHVTVKPKGTDNLFTYNVTNVFVGDLWILAGQSNMEGYGDLIDVAPTNPKVMALGMDGKWVQAEEPLHWLVDSPDSVHSGDPKTREERSKAAHRSRAKGAGLGLTFASAMVAATNVPIGLICAAHGGTSMAQWSPAKKGEGGASLYGSMLRQVNLAGGRAKGVLWYQGESDAMNAESAKNYPKVFADFIGEVRKDLNQPALPFYLVQIGRFVVANPDPRNWNAVQDAQRRIPEAVADTGVVAAIDLELDDLIHVGTQGLKRLGTRLSRLVLREQFGQVGASTPDFERVTKGSGNSLMVKFKGVNRGGSPGFPTPPGFGQPFRGMRPTGQDPFGRRSEEGSTPGLQPERHIAGFSIRKADGVEIPLIFEATVGPSKDSVILKLTGKVPEGSFLWYGYGFDPYCNLGDSLDMGVPVFGPIPLPADK